jgi:hypothetical protein
MLIIIYLDFGGKLMESMEKLVELKQAIKEDISQLLIAENNIRSEMKNLELQLNSTIQSLELIVKTIASSNDILMSTGMSFKFDKNLDLIIIFPTKSATEPQFKNEIEVTSESQLSDLLQCDSAEIIPIGNKNE